MAASRSIQLGSRLKELRIHLCQTSAASKGVREFVEKEYINLKKANPKTPILVRECSGILPKIWARYEYGRESSASVTDKSSNEVLKQIEQLAQET